MKNKLIKGLLFAFIVFVIITSVRAQDHKNYETSSWEAKWISVPNNDPIGYSVCLFRKKIFLQEKPESFPVYVSADNRYKLYVNEKLVLMGPAKSDLSNWRFESVNLAAYLVAGDNIISAKVWNEGEYRPESQVSFRTGFILQGDTNKSQVLNTGHGWKCIQDSSYSPIVVSMFRLGVDAVQVPGWYIAGPGEKIDMHQHITGWQSSSFNDSNWQKPQIISQGIPKNAVGVDVTSDVWRLVKSPLPQMELSIQRIKEVRKATGINVPETFPESISKITVPAKSTVTLLLDQNFLTNAYPTVIFSGGNNSIISLTYAESLYEDKNKGNRDDVEGKNVIGRKDIIISNGADRQIYTSLAYRTFRYIELKIETKNSPLTIEDIYGTFTGYPFELNAKLESINTELNKMFEIGWRTARLCANETYMDCPYWEQLQYVGDTRIQAMVSLYNSGDDRLVKNAINLIDQSRMPDGITLSRYPTINSQIIPTFSLQYIGMLHDYMMYGSDMSFVATKLNGMRQILEYFEHFTAEDGSVKNLPNWFFTDWAEGWNRGMGPIGSDGSSAIIDLQLLLAYQNAAAIEQYCGLKELTSLYNDKAEKLARMIKNKYWDESKKLFADTQDKDQFSQHTNSMAILAKVVTGEKVEMLGQLLLKDSNLTQASIYFKYYVHQALVQAGLGNNYLNWLAIWKKNMELGLTTWGEDSHVESTRSDCHAWGASPNIEFLRTILGIDSDAPCFSTVKIEPHLGSIKEIGGEMPHPNGKIKVDYKTVNKHIRAFITLPENISGTFIWKGKKVALTGGNNIIEI